MLTAVVDNIWVSKVRIKIVIANLSKIAFGIEQFMQLIELALGSQVTVERCR